MLLELTGAVSLGWPVWGNVLAVVGGAVLIAAAYAGLNVARGRSWSTLPQDVGVPELAFFVLVPAVLPAVFGASGTPRSSRSARTSCCWDSCGSWSGTASDPRCGGGSRGSRTSSAPPS
ncbi:hypothetical protein NKG05_22095 [Oerskovia sp. M15]